MRVSTLLVVLLGTCFAVQTARSASPDVYSDASSRLEWTAKDNGSGIDLIGAYAYCENLTLDFKADWRLPSFEELGTLFKAEAGTGHPSWAGRSANRAWSVSMKDNRTAWIISFEEAIRVAEPVASKRSRALCVRNTEAAAPYSARLLVTVDAPSYVIFDDRFRGFAPANQLVGIGVSPGQHKVQAVSTDTGAVVARSVAVPAMGDISVPLSLQPMVAKQKAKQAADQQSDEAHKRATAELRKRFIATSRKTVIDQVTRLEWTGEDSREVDWNEANAYCANLTWGELSDWRLPTIAELLEMNKTASQQQGYCCPVPPGMTVYDRYSRYWSSDRSGDMMVALDLSSVTGDMRGYAPVTFKSGTRAYCVRRASP